MKTTVTSMLFMAAFSLALTVNGQAQNAGQIEEERTEIAQERIDVQREKQR